MPLERHSVDVRVERAESGSWKLRIPAQRCPEPRDLSLSLSLTCTCTHECPHFVKDVSSQVIPYLLTFPLLCTHFSPRFVSMQQSLLPPPRTSPPPGSTLTTHPPYSVSHGVLPRQLLVASTRSFASSVLLLSLAHSAETAHQLS